MPIKVTLLGILNEVNPVHPLNAELPILVTLLPVKLTDVKFGQSIKARLAILTHDVPKVTDFISVLLLP
jgi:hypothetical protein